MKLAFMHIPKTGGVSVEECIKKVVEADLICPAYYPNEFHGKSYQDFHGHKVFVGHFDFDFMQTLDSDFVTAVVVRDPLSQLLSLYNHIATRENHPDHDSVKEEKKGFHELSSSSKFMQNTLTKYILGKPKYRQVVELDGNKKSKADEACRLARDHMKKFTVIGTTGKLTKFVRDLASATKLDLPVPGRENISTKKLITKKSMTEEDSAAFRRATWLDRPVFNMISQEFLKE